MHRLFKKRFLAVYMVPQLTGTVFNFFIFCVSIKDARQIVDYMDKNEVLTLKCVDVIEMIVMLSVKKLDNGR